MGQAPSKAITTEADSQETSLPSPRFDELAAQMARPVVPLNTESVSTNPGSTINLRSRPASLLSKKGSWLLAAFVGLILTAGAMAIGVTAYKRNPVVSTPGLVPTTEAIRLELNQEPRPNQSISSSASAATKNKKRVRRARPTSNANPRARLVDSYIVR